jgi:RyR domain
MNNEAIARVCHAANREFCETLGDRSQKSWDEAEEWQRQSAIKGVQFAIDNPNVPASAQHEAWLADKFKDGWKYGVVKDAVAKTHPCFVPFDALSPEQQIKDHLFKAVVKAMTGRK